jgi:DNA-binding NarL/FixJ family response regulator
MASLSAPSNPPAVLLVDDNDMILARAADALTNACEIVGTAKDGAEALEAIDALHPNVLVLDVSMRGMNGFEVATRLRQSGSTIPIVFLTVHDEEEFVQAAREMGGMGYVVKPRLASDLLTAVMEVHAGRPFVSQLP